MKKLFFIGISLVLLVSCSDSNLNETPIDEGLTADADVEDINEIGASFRNGDASNGQEYYSGLLAEVVAVDLKFREVTRLDEEDATEPKIKACLDSILSKIEKGRAAINIYANESWPKRAEFHELTVEWYTVIEELVNNYLYALAEPMSRPDDTWNEEELLLFDDYTVAYDTFHDIDERWIDFQHVYADANDFIIEGVIDEEALIDEELSEDY